jgi:hypothetical protein
MDNKPALHLVKLTDEEAREMAMKMYVETTPIQLGHIAMRVGRSKEQIVAWRNEGRWLDERKQYQFAERRKLFEGLKSPEEIDRILAGAIQNILDECKRRLAPENIKQLHPSDVRILNSLVKDAQETLEKIARKAGKHLRSVT